MKLFLTGDTHIPIDIEKLNTKNFPQQKSLTRDDFVIVLGDFGLLWKEDKTYLWWKRWIEERNYTLLWLDGNHENHNWIDSLPVSEWNGGKVHVVSPNIIHLMRGQVFTLGGKTFFTYGGAMSYDKAFRTPNVTWWAREEGSFREEQEALANLEKHGNKVDYILTHTCPDELLQPMFHFRDIARSTTGQFLNCVANLAKFQDWYFGHMHEDKDFGRYHVLYNNIKQVF